MVDLLRGAPCRSAVRNSRSRRTGWHELENQSANCLRLVFSGSTSQNIRPFKSVGSLNSHLPIFARRAIRRSTRATLLVCHSVRAQDQQQFPYTAKHHRDSAAQSSIPSYCNFIEVPAALVLVQTGQSGAGSGGQAGRRTAYPQYLLENLGARQVRCQGGAHAWCPRRKLKLTRQTTRL